MALILKRVRHATMILAFFVPFICHAENAEPKKLIALQEYIAANSQFMKDPPTFQYVLVRCTAMYNALSARFNRETASDRLAVQSQLNSKASDYLTYSFNVGQSQIDKKSDHLAHMQADIIQLMQIYDANMNDASLRLGSFWNDETVKSDYDTCEGLLTYIASRSK